MATTNATVKFTYKNTGTFFGIHVTADPFTLSYSQLNLAAGDVSLPSLSSFLPIWISRSKNETDHICVCSSRSSTRGGAGGGRRA